MLEEHSEVELVLAVAALGRLQGTGTGAVEDVVRPPDADELELDAVLAVKSDALDERRAHPIVRPERSVDTQIVALEESIVPERVDADARVEAEVDKGDRREAGLVVGPEGEEVVEGVGEVGALGRADGSAQRAANQPLAHEVQRRKEDPGAPECHLTRGRRSRASTLVVGHRALRRGGRRRCRARRWGRGDADG